MKVMPYSGLIKAKNQACLTMREKEDFPAIYSLLDPQALVPFVVRYYSIDIPKGCQFWHRGLSDVYIVDTLSGLYILRVSHHHWRTKTEIDFELELLDFLHQQNLPVAHPIRTREDKLSVEIDAPEGKRYAVLFPYAPGEIAVGDLNQNQAYLLGETVAKIHRITQDFQTLAYRQPLTPEYLLDLSLDSIAPFLHHRTQDLQFLVDDITQIKEQLEVLPTELPYWGVCWGDPHSGNVHFTEDNRMTLFDFDQCGYGWRLFDIAKFLQVSLQTGLNKRVRDEFIRGYQSDETLTEKELDCLQALTQTAYIWSWAISLETTKLYDYSRLHNYYFTQRLERLKRLKSKDWQLF